MSPDSSPVGPARAYLVFILMFFVLGGVEFVRTDPDVLFGASMLLCGTGLVLYEQGKRKERPAYERIGTGLAAVAVVLALYDVLSDFLG